MTDNARIVREALERAWHLGQVYWQQADSEYLGQNRKADRTQEIFRELVASTLTVLETELATLKAPKECHRSHPHEDDGCPLNHPQHIEVLRDRAIMQGELQAAKADLERAREEERERIMVLFRIVEHAVHEDSWCQECALENVIPAIANFRAALAPEQKDQLNKENS